MIICCTLLLGIASNTTTRGEELGPNDDSSWELSESASSCAGAVFSIATSADGDLFAVGGGEGENSYLAIGDWSNLAQARLLESRPGTIHVHSVDLDDDGRFVVAGYSDGVVALFDVAKSNRLWSTDAHERFTRAVRFSNDGASVYSAGDDGYICAWSAATGELQWSIATGQNEVSALEVSPDGMKMASAGNEGMLAIWDVKNRSRLGAIAKTRSLIDDIAFSPDGQVLACAGPNSSVLVFDTTPSPRTFEPRATIETSAGIVWSVDFGPDGQELAIAHGTFVSVAKVETGEITASWKAHRLTATWLRFGKDGRSLLSGSWDRTIARWELGGESNNSID